MLRITLLILVVVIVILLLPRLLSGSRAIPSAGSAAPDFTLPSQEGAPVRLQDFRGSWMLGPGIESWRMNFPHFAFYKAPGSLDVLFGHCVGVRIARLADVVEGELQEVPGRKAADLALGWAVRWANPPPTPRSCPRGA